MNHRKKDISFEEYLGTINLESSKESDLVKKAVSQLNDKQNKHIVRRDLIFGLQALATKQDTRYFQRRISFS